MGQRFSFAWLVIALVACGSQGIDLNAGGDAGTSTNGDPPPTSFNDPFANAPAYAVGSEFKHGDGNPTLGESCGTTGSGCHEHPEKGGWVFKDYAGTIPAPGVEIRYVDGQGNVQNTYSNSKGMFNVPSGVSFPVYVGARDGTTQRPMITQLTSSMGDCSQGGCHVGTANGGYYPIHVP